MRILERLRPRQVMPVNVPVHQIMFTHDPNALPPVAADKIRFSAGGNPYRMWFLDDTRTLLGSVYGVEVLEAFDILQPFAYKADLARYCIVNHFGGIYIDLTITDFLGFDTRDYDFVGFRDANTAETSWRVANGLFYSTKNSPILQACISECVANVQRRYYGKTPLFPTGPDLFGRAIANHSLDLKIQLGDHWWRSGRPRPLTLPDRGVIAHTKTGGRNLGGVSGIPGGNNYNVMWRERTIYRSAELVSEHTDRPAG